MPMVNMGGVHNTLKFNGIRGEVGDMVAATFKEHGHRGQEAVRKELQRLHDTNEMDAREFRHVQDAIEQHAITEGTV